MMVRALEAESSTRRSCIDVENCTRLPLGSAIASWQAGLTLQRHATCGRRQVLRILVTGTCPDLPRMTLCQCLPMSPPRQVRRSSLHLCPPAPFVALLRMPPADQSRVRTQLYGNPGDAGGTWDDGATWDGASARRPRYRLMSSTTCVST
jgi:hypothetical protein